MVAIKTFIMLLATLLALASLYLFGKKMQAERVRVKAPARNRQRPSPQGLTRLRRDPVTGVYRPE